MTNTFGYWWNQLVYGRYSSKFNEYCQRKDIPTPYRLCFAEDPIDHVHEILNLNEKIPVFHTSVEILFEKQKFSISRKKLIITYGQPHSYSVMKIGEYDLNAFCYKKIFKGKKVKCIYFFYNDKFFMGQYTFSEYSPHLIQEISSLFIEKFQVPEAKDHVSFYLEDDYNHRFMIQDTGFSVNCKFVSLANENIIKPLIDFYKPELPEKS